MEQWHIVLFVLVGVVLAMAGACLWLDYRTEKFNRLADSWRSDASERETKR